MTLDLSSTAPRPQTNPSWTIPWNAGCVHASSVPGMTGTTSVCPMRTNGSSPGSVPAQVYSSERPFTVSRASSACTRG